MKDLRIKVLSRQNVEKFLTEEPHIVISVRDMGSPPATLPENEKRIAELFLEFSDSDGETLHQVYKSDVIKMFTPEDAKSVLKVVQLTLPYINLIVVNCEAGICRSSAIAAAISRLLGLSDMSYFDPRGPYRPNRFVYRTIMNQGMEDNFHAPKD